MSENSSSVICDARRGGSTEIVPRLTAVQWIERLSRLFGTTGRLLIKELSGFGVVGVVAFLIDLGVFQLLYAHAGVGAVTSKFVSTLVSMTVAYFGHRHWSFSHRARTNIRHEYVLFAVINGSTLLMQLGIVALVRYPMGLDGALQLQIANVFAIGLTTVIRYLAYRRWVFPAHPGSAAAEVTADPAPRNVPDAA
jgi:putative flippase GtrA